MLEFKKIEAIYYLKTPLNPGVQRLRNSIIRSILVIAKEELTNHVYIQILHNRVS